MMCNKKMMSSRIIRIAGALLCTGLLAGCAAESSDSVVKLKSEVETQTKLSAKDKDQSDKSSVSPSIPLREALEAPETCSRRAEDFSGRLQIVTEATVDIPTVFEAPVLPVVKQPLDQAQIDRITKAFFQNADVYDAQAYRKDQTLKKLQAPYTFQEEPMDAWDASVGTTNKVYGAVRLPDQSCCRYDLEQREGYTGAWMKKTDGMDGLWEARPYAWASYDAMKSLYTWVVDEKTLADKIGISQKEAKKTADTMAARLQIKDLEAAACEPVLEMDANYKGVPGKENVTGYGYAFHYTRKPGGIPVTYTQNTTAGCEVLDIYVTKDGIDEILFANPLTYGEAETEAGQLLPFSDIMDIYEKMLAVSREGMFVDQRDGVRDADAPVQSMAYHTERIKFGYARIGGMLVPVWDFFGTYELSYDGKNKIRVCDTQKSFLTIRAADGTVVDRAAGY